MNNQKVVEVLEKLIEVCRDGQNGFREAAEHVSDPELRSFFSEQSSERARFAEQLQGEVQRLGKPDPERKGRVAAALHRTWIDLKSALGGGDRSILEAVEQGEDNAKKNYEEALKEDLPEPIKGMIRSQAQGVIAAHDRVKLVRDRKAA
jgi:uncharacterized protein (TIGR02284 family)